MAFKKPKKEKKSRLKDIEDILKKLRPYKPLPFPKSFDPRDFLEMIEAFDNELGRNVFVSKIKVLEDEGRYSPTKRAGGGVMNINTMTEPLGYDDGGDVGFLEGIRQSLNNFIKYNY